MRSSVAALLVFPPLLLASFGQTSSAEDRKEPPRTYEPVKLTDEALALHREALVFDGHNDLPWMFREKEDLSFRKIDLRKGQKDLHTDIPRLRKGGVGA